MNFNGKKLFLIGFIVVLLIGIPLTVYLLQQQANINSHAQASSNLTFSPDSTSAAPIQKNVGDTIPLDVTLDPGKNLVGFVKLVIQYDPSVLATASANAFTVNPNALPAILEGPVYSSGQVAVTLSAGADPTKVIQAKTTLATITFKALKDTPPGTPTLVTYTTNTQVMSSGPNDQAAENVLSSASPATIAIGGASPSEGIPPSPTPSGMIATPTPTTAPAPTTTTPSGAAPTPTIAPTTPITSGSPSNNVPPVCNSLAVDRTTTGNAPFSLTFTTNGSDSDGTISKVTFNFGDGQVSDVTQAGGIGTASVNVQASHTYNNPGTYQATAVLTDNNGGVSTNSSSSSANCSQTITVNAASGSATTSGTNPSPTMPPTGSTGLTIGIGLSAALLIIGGGLLFFIL